MKKFKMPFELMTIEHLGLRLYSTLPPVISELVSNAFDAESASVSITVPSGPLNSRSEVIVRDYGHGMTDSELQNEYLPIGRCRRGEDGSAVMSKHAKRRVTGRKGLGKLSAFGVADELEIRSIQNHQATTLRLSYPGMKDWGRTHPPGDYYEPEVVPDRTGPTDESDGLEVILRGFHRTKPIDPDTLRKGIAKRLTLIDRGFDVKVNGKGIQPGDRVNRTMCESGLSWSVDELDQDVLPPPSINVTGWVGFLSDSSQVNRGINIFANNKAAELGSFFNLESTHAQYARAYLVGELHADFLDEKEDMISTARDSVVWETEPGAAFQDWGRKLIGWMLSRWVEKKRKDKEETIIKAAGFDKWLATRSEGERRVANKLVKILATDDKLDPSSMAPILDIIKSSVESMSFRELVDILDEKPANTEMLLKLFDEWRLIEAREHLKLADGRVSAMEQLETFIRTGALEVQQLQPLLEKNIWLVNPTWNEVNAQTTYTEMLRKHCKEPKELEDADRRLDIYGVSHGGALTVVEIKRPEKVLSRKDLEQIASYVDWARTQLGTGPHAPTYIDGLLVVGSLSQKADVQAAMKRNKSDDIRTETFKDLHQRAREYYGKVDDLLKAIAPEYARSARSKSAKKR